jgi:hypothetical protein
MKVAMDIAWHPNTISKVLLNTITPFVIPCYPDPVISNT